MTSDRHLVSRVVIVAALLLTMAVAFVSHSALRSFEAELRPELEREASVVGEIGARTLQRAIELGVPFGSLSGVDEYLVSLLTAQQGLSYVLLTDAVGQTIASAAAGGRPDAPARRQLRCCATHTGRWAHRRLDTCRHFPRTP